MEASNDRYIDHLAISSLSKEVHKLDIKEASSLIKEHLSLCKQTVSCIIITISLSTGIKDYEDRYPILSTKRLQSNEKVKTDPSLYTGSGGTSFVYLKLYIHATDEKEKAHYKERFLTCLNHNIEVGKGRGDSCPSFFQSGAGLFTVGALFYQDTGDKDGVEAMVKELVDMYEAMN